ncbi:MAG: lamin tail domain-containing protein [Chitinophagaceae bacterium]
MKKNLLLLCLLFFLFNAGKSQIVITEIMYNPPESGTDSLEFIEIYNAGNSNVSLLNHSFTWGGSVKRHIFTTDTVLAPKSFFVLAITNANAVRRQYKLAYTPTIPAVAAGLGNSSTTIKLLNATDQTLDSVLYSNTWGGNGNGSSLNLCDITADNALQASWAASTTLVGSTINGQALKASPGAFEACTPLPVKWLQVGINEQPTGSVSLFWQVQEIDVLNYVVEQSNNGLNYTSIGGLPSKGNGVNNYTFTANTELGNYFRIKQVDNNGSFTYSQVLAAKQTAMRVIKASPNPTKQLVVLNVDEKLAKETFFVYNQQGMILQTFKPNKQTFQVNLSSYAKGVYYIKSESGKSVNIVKY